MMENAGIYKDKPAYVQKKRASMVPGVPESLLLLSLAPLVITKEIKRFGIL